MALTGGLLLPGYLASGGAAPGKEFDFIVYGGTSAGIVAAVAAVQEVPYQKLRERLDWYLHDR